MNLTNYNIDANEVSRLTVGNSVIRIIQNDRKLEAEQYQNQQWEPLTRMMLGSLILNPRAKTWLNEHCEDIVLQFEEDKVEQQDQRKAESVRRANEWRQIADLKHGKLEVRVLELKTATGRKVQLNNKDKWQDCSEQEIRAIRSISPFNELFIRHFDKVAGSSTAVRAVQ